MTTLSEIWSIHRGADCNSRFLDVSQIVKCHQLFIFRVTRPTRLWTTADEPVAHVNKRCIWYVTFSSVLIFLFILPDQRLYTANNNCIYIYIYIYCTHTHTHTYVTA